MTTLLETAFEKASSLTLSEQNTFARILIEEIESEKKWDTLLGNSEELLSRMADDALNEFNLKETTLFL